MTTSSENPEQLSPLQNALYALKKLRGRLEALERARNEPIAVVGMGCRFPGGANDPAAFWELLRAGADATSEVPPDRWDVEAFYDPDPQVPGKTYMRSGGFLRDVAVDRFDAEFFGIAPREAVGMDPQQRLLLEVAWEALEHAGYAPSSLAGTRTGVFIGVMNNDYGQLAGRHTDIAQIDAYTATGNSFSFLAGRVSYHLGLQGPSMVVDTACSSSLVTLHLACQSLRNGECSLALSGGVSLILTPETNVMLSRLRAIAADGRCKTFDADADGYGRGEGCGVLVLKRLSDALRDGDPILALVRGSAVNHDGPSSGLTVPNGPAQQAVIQAALESAGVAPAAIDYVEAHGTGTPLGDPIEVNALAAVLGPERPAERPLLVGTVKANIGHLEPAAGVAGLIKVILAFQHGEIPPHRYVDNPNPHIAWSELPLALPRAPLAWPRGERPRLAGISSFGMSGINAHVVLEEPPLPAAPAEAEAQRPAHLLVLSARREAALRELAERYAAHLAAHPDAALADVAHTAAVGRSHFAARLAVVASDTAEARELLARYAAGDSAPGLLSGQTERNRPKIAFLCTGQGAQYVGMGRELYATQPVFRAAIDRCAELLQAELDADIRPIMFGNAGAEHAETLNSGDSELLDAQCSMLDSTQYTQPALFCLGYALAELWRSWGVEPAALLGHSVGEYVAACLAGVFSLEDGLKLIAARARLMQALPAGGAMTAVFADEQQTRALIADEPRLAVAVLNSPAETVVSGPAEALAALEARCAEQGLKTRRLAVSHAFHSALMDPVLEPFERVVAGLELRAPRIPLVANLTGQPADAAISQPGYWRRQLREPVRFAAGLRALQALGCDCFIEIGPTPTLLSKARQTIADERMRWLPSLRKGQDEWRQILDSLGQLYLRGAAPDWRGFDQPYPRRRVELPTYPFQRRRYWLELAAPAPAAPLQTIIPAQNGAAAVATYYDSLARGGQGGITGEVEQEQIFLTFAPLPEPLPGYSWLWVLAMPDRYPELKALLQEAQREMREVLFRLVDLQSCQRVLDFGCGYASDLLAMGQRYPHLELHGFTISPEQARIGNRKIRAAGLEDRVKVYNQDSTRDDFPSRYDLVIGIEVAVHIENKEGLFANIDRHLNNGGFVVMADFISRTAVPVTHAETSSHIITQEQWCDVLARHKLKVVACVDVSREIGNFFHDPDFHTHLAEVARDLSPVVAENFRSYGNMGPMLQRGMVSYTLFIIQKDTLARKDEILSLNRQQLQMPLPYAAATGRAPAPHFGPHPLIAARAGQGDEQLYRVAWQAAPLASTPRPAEPGAWIILADAGGVGAALARQLEARGDWCALVRPGAAFAALEPRRYQVRPGQRADLERLLAEPSWQAARRGVLHLWGLDADDAAEQTPEQIEQTTAELCGGALALAQALLAAPAASGARLWLVTHGAQALGGAPVRVAQSPLWGLGRVIALEHPELWGGLTDLDGPPEPAAALLLGALDQGGDEDQQVFRSGQRYVARLERAPLGRATGEPVAIRADASYLITGGLGGLGLHTARWLVERGARHLVLSSRSGLPARETWLDPSHAAATREQIAAVQALEAAGARVLVGRADAADSAAMAALFEQIARELPPLRGVVHAAGWSDQRPLAELSQPGMRELLRPKTAGAWLLHRLTAGQELDFFVAFSSIASVWGSAGMAHYAAGNAFLDGLAHARRAAGLPALSINWGPWASGGMTSPEAQAQLAQIGVTAFAPAQALALLERLLPTSQAQVAAALVDWTRFRAVYAARRARPLLERLAEPAMPAVPVQAAPAVASALLGELTQAQPERRRELLAAEVERLAARVLRLEPGQPIDPHQPLNEIGLDSLMVVELTDTLSKTLGRTFPTTLIFNYPTVESLAEHLDDLLFGVAPAAPAAPAPAAPPEAAPALGLDDVTQLSDAEAEALLLEKLSSITKASTHDQPR